MRVVLRRVIKKTLTKESAIEQISDFVIDYFKQNNETLKKIHEKVVSALDELSKRGKRRVSNDRDADNDGERDDFRPRKSGKKLASQGSFFEGRSEDGNENKLFSVG